MLVSFLASVVFFLYASTLSLNAPANRSAPLPPSQNATNEVVGESHYVPPPAPPASEIPVYALLVSVGAFLVSTIGTASTVILAGGTSVVRRQNRI